MGGPRWLFWERGRSFSKTVRLVEWWVEPSRWAAGLAAERRAFRVHGVEPYAYLKDVLTHLPRTTNKEVAQLTPRRWKTAQRPPVPLAA